MKNMTEEYLGYAEFKKQHTKLLQSQKWKDTRKQILDRDKQCLVCESTDTLHIHHKKYSMPLKNSFFDHNNLITLCQKCHSNVAHPDKNKPIKFNNNKQTNQGEVWVLSKNGVVMGVTDNEQLALKIKKIHNKEIYEQDFENSVDYQKFNLNHVAQQGILFKYFHNITKQDDWIDDSRLEKQGEIEEWWKISIFDNTDILLEAELFAPDTDTAIDQGRALTHNILNQKIPKVSALNSIFKAVKKQPHKPKETYIDNNDIETLEQN